ncbi:protein POLLENLESS 3-LIKE 2-like [Tasmannia lanceolata]|uniref:protein POLLENLESS 3-LIKE 2-like n=1 Tax=Tasmannia lanceolata TaxID=3420 RepID=UPI0040641080
MMWKSAPYTPIMTVKNDFYPIKGDSYHVLHKLPVGNSPYVKAKHVQLVDSDPEKAISLFWTAINTGDRVDSALKDMAVVMKQTGRAEEAIEAIRSFRHLCSHQSQEALDNVLLDLYKKCDRIDDQIELLQYKLMLIEEGLAFGGKKMKIARSQGKRFYVSIEQERARLLGNLAYACIQQCNYHAAEIYYRAALAIKPDKNGQCNLALCLMQTGRIAEAKSILHGPRFIFQVL